MLCHEMQDSYLQHGRLIGDPYRLEVLIRIEAVMVGIGMEGVKQLLPRLPPSDVINHKLCLRDVLHTPGWLAICSLTTHLCVVKLWF